MTSFMRSTVLVVALLAITATQGCKRDNPVDTDPPSTEDGLIACYSFDGVGTDGSGNGFHAQVYGNPELVQDRHGNRSGAMRFGRNETYMLVPGVSGTRWEMDSAITVAFWVYGYSSDVDLPGFHCCGNILTKFKGFGDGYSVKWFHNNDSKLQFGLVQNSSGVSTPMDSIRFDNRPLLLDWHHVVYTYSLASRTLRMYLNGELVREKSNCSYNFRHSGTDVSIGGAILPVSYGGTTNSVADVALDDMRVYDIELSAQRVEQLYRASAGCGCTDVYEDL